MDRAAKPAPRSAAEEVSYRRYGRLGRRALCRRGLAKERGLNVCCGARRCRYRSPGSCTNPRGGDRPPGKDSPTAIHPGAGQEDPRRAARRAPSASSSPACSFPDRTSRPRRAQSARSPCAKYETGCRPSVRSCRSGLRQRGRPSVRQRARPSRQARTLELTTAATHTPAA